MLAMTKRLAALLVTPCARCESPMLDAAVERLVLR
jgi:hypothetical protein